MKTSTNQKISIAFVSILLASLFVVFIPLASATELVTNGDFETGNLNGWNLNIAGKGNVTTHSPIVGTYSFYTNNASFTLSQTFANISSTNMYLTHIINGGYFAYYVQLYYNDSTSSMLHSPMGGSGYLERTSANFTSGKFIQYLVFNIDTTTSDFEIDSVSILSNPAPTPTPGPTSPPINTNVTFYNGTSGGLVVPNGTYIGTYNLGDGVGFYAYPSVGYILDYITSTAGTVSINGLPSDNRWTLSFTQNGTVIVYFTNAAVPIWNIQSYTSTGGTMTPFYNSNATTEGTTISLLSVPDIGYTFDHWQIMSSGSGSNSILQNSIYTDSNGITVYSDIDITPIFIWTGIPTASPTPLPPFEQTFGIFGTLSFYWALLYFALGVITTFISIVLFTFVSKIWVIAIMAYIAGFFVQIGVYSSWITVGGFIAETVIFLLILSKWKIGSGGKNK